MPSASPSARPRPGGGFNQGMGQFGEHMDEAAMQKAASQKALSQQQTNPALAKAAAQAQKNKGKPSAQSGSQSLGSISDELVKKPWQDMKAEVGKFFSINTWLGIEPTTEDPEKKARMTQIHQRYQQLDREQQQVAQRKYQEEMQKKKLEEEEKERKRQEEMQQQQQAIVPPSSPKKGPVGPASGKSKKQNATALLQQQRQTLSQGSGSN